MNRRDFIQVASTAGSGLILGFYLPSTNKLTGKPLASTTFEPNAWIKVQPDNFVRIMVAKSEMGQHIRTSIPMIIAEELEADWSHVKVVQAETHPDKYGSQSTGGSGSIRRSYMRLRKAGATAREMLIEAASIKWDVPAKECKAQMSKVIHSKSKRSLSFGDLAPLAGTLNPPEDPNLKNEKDFKIT